MIARRPQPWTATYRHRGRLTRWLLARGRPRSWNDRRRWTYRTGLTSRRGRRNA